MRQMIGLVAATAATLLLLTGCASTAAPDVSASKPVAEDVAPLVAATPDEVTPDSPEAGFLTEVRPYIDKSTQIPDATDDQLLLAGEDACTQIADGTLPDKVRVIQDEQPDDLGYYVDSGRIGYFAAEYLCV